MSKSSLLVTALFMLALWGAYSVYKPFLLSMVVAVLLSMATFNLTNKFFLKTNSAQLSASISTLLMSLLLFAPIVYLATVGVGYISQIDIAGIQQTVASIKDVVKDIPVLHNLANQYLTDDKVIEYIKASTSYITVAGGVGFGFIKNMVFVVIFYFFINYYGNKFFDTILELLPVDTQKGSRMMQDVSSTMEIVFYSIIVTAIFEGFLFGVIMSSYGFNGLFFGMIYGFASLIPIIGGVIVWLPVSLYAWTKIDSQTAITIALYSVVVISIIADTFVKPMIIKVISYQRGFFEKHYQDKLYFDIFLYHSWYEYLWFLGDDTRTCYYSIFDSYH